MKMVHTCIRVKDLTKSLAFYKEALNFEEVSRKDYPEYKFTLVYLSLPGDPYQLELTYNYDYTGYDLGDGYGHIAISVADVLTSHEAHKAAGFETTDLKGLPDSAFRYYFIMDPDGYKIEVVPE